ncbi:hypothetical protein [Nostocoides sp. HKS02]|nr:hypothetical protein [Tetrasphaera sp. HKS02]
MNDPGQTTWTAVKRYANIHETTVKFAPTAKISSRVTHESANR